MGVSLVGRCTTSSWCCMAVLSTGVMHVTRQGSALILIGCVQANGIFLRLLSLDSSTSLTARDVIKAKRLKKAEGLLKSFFGNSLHLLGKLQAPEVRANPRSPMRRLSPALKEAKELLASCFDSNFDCCPMAYALLQQGCSKILRQ